MVTQAVAWIISRNISILGLENLGFPVVFSENRDTEYLYPSEEWNPVRKNPQQMLVFCRLGVDEWIILGRITRRWDVGIWTGLGWSRIEVAGGRL